MAYQPEFKLPKVIKVTSAEQARDLAIDWQSWLQDAPDQSYAEVIYYQNYFESLAEKFPELTDEFKENAII